MSKQSNPLTRRQVIKGAASVLGGTIAAAQLGTIVSRAAEAATTGQPPEFFDDNQFALLERIVDTMIPETDTPGAHAVGAHYFIDLMMSEWASPERQARYVDGLGALEEQLQGQDGDSFVDVPADRQLELLRAVDLAAFADDSGNNFYREFKKMVLFAYYTTQAGATEELQYEPLPGMYQPCLTADDDTRAWFHLGFRHGL